jgi:hypothetical protein
MKCSKKKNYNFILKQDNEILQKYPIKPNYKYPCYSFKSKPHIDLTFIQNKKHLKEAMLEWRRKRALINRSVRNKRKVKNTVEKLFIQCDFCKKIIQHPHLTINHNIPEILYCNNIGLVCDTKQTVEYNFNNINMDCLDVFLELNKLQLIDLIIEGTQIKN